MLKRPHYVATAAVVGLVLVLLNLPDTAASRTKQVVGSLFLPCFGLVASTQGLADQAARSLTPRRSLLHQVDSLQRENHHLRLELLQTTEAARENARLRQLLGWQKQAPWTGRPARVIARDPADWWHTLQIDLGARDHLRSDLPVLTPEGLVGRVGRVNHTTAEVILVGDPKCRVAALVRETGEQGVLSSVSSGVLDHRLVDLTHLPRNLALKPGQTVYTSGLGGVFPAGIPVGIIVDYRSVSYGLYAEARVKLFADTSRLETVLVLIP